MQDLGIHRMAIGTGTVAMQRDDESLKGLSRPKNRRWLPMLHASHNGSNKDVDQLQLRKAIEACCAGLEVCIHAGRVTTSSDFVNLLMPRAQRGFPT